MSHTWLCPIDKILKCPSQSGLAATALVSTSRRTWSDGRLSSAWPSLPPPSSLLPPPSLPYWHEIDIYQATTWLLILSAIQSLHCTDSQIEWEFQSYHFISKFKVYSNWNNASLDWASLLDLNWTISTATNYNYLILKQKAHPSAFEWIFHYKYWNYKYLLHIRKHFFEYKVFTH